MRTLSAILCVCAFAGLLPAGCSRDIPTVSLGIDDFYYVRRMSKLSLHPALTGSAYRWTLHRQDGTDSVLSTERDYIFMVADEGVYNLTFDIIDAVTPFRHDFTVSVIHEEVEYSPYISRVYEYCPAPGQFVNEMPLYEEGDTYADILRKAEESLSGTNDVLVSLGGYGGYITFGFDHTVVNRPGLPDFRIWGNAFYELLGTGRKGGSAEPGIVMVSYDTNCNGIPDDEWYELAGSEYSSSSTIHNYSITYRRPDNGREIVPDYNANIEDLYYIKWTDSRGFTGYVSKNTFHSQDYFPKWVSRDELSFSGSCLPANGVDVSGYGGYYVLYSYDWGYVDNHPNDYPELNSFDISNAVDSQGRHVHLPGVDFIRVYTAVNQYCGWLGETSTEISRAQDLGLPVPSNAYNLKLDE